MILTIILIILLIAIILKIILDFLKEKELIRSSKFEEYLKYKKESEEEERKFIFNLIRFFVLIAGIIILGGSISFERFAISGIFIGLGLILSSIFVNKILNLD